MSLDKIHLRKLLRILYSDDRDRRSLLRSDIRGDIKKEEGVTGDGGDFYGPFWTDAKAHVAGTGSLPKLTRARIEANKARARLYPQLQKGFLEWWNEKRRWRNEPISLLEGVKGPCDLKELGVTIKVENVLALTVGDDFKRIIYPYFRETPILPNEGVRVGLWVIREALQDQGESNLRFLDILRSSSFGIIDVPLKGDEKEILLRRYGEAVKEWKKLRKEYD